MDTRSAELTKYASNAMLAPSDITIAMALAELMQESGDAAGALAVVEELEKTWPHMALFPKKRAEILDKMEDAAGARAAREKALSLSGDDLKLRQALAITEGKEILPGALEDGLAWIERYRAAKPTEDAPATLVLDSYVTEIHPDGTATSLTQTLYKAVNQEGAGQIAEVEIPPGAEILVLRTIKEDGRIRCATFRGR